MSVVVMFKSLLKEHVKNKLSSSDSSNRNEWHHVVCYDGHLFCYRIEKVSVSTATTFTKKASNTERTDISINGILIKMGGILVNTVF